MKFCFVILSYNHPELTAQAVRAAKACELSSASRIPIYLVHNGSLAQHETSLRKSFPEIYHISLKENRGYSGGANAGISEALREHEWALFLTNDCEIQSIPKLPSSPSLLVPKILIRKTGRVDSLGGGFLPRAGRLSHLRDEASFERLKKQRAWRVYAPGSAFAVHQAVWKATHGFDETLGTYWEDVDWSLRVQNLGYELNVDPNWTIEHKIGRTCRKDSRYTIFYYQRNQKIVSFRYARGLEKLRLSFLLLWTWIRLGFKLLLQKRFSDSRLLLKAALGL